jgi:hypothetical protein
LISFVETIRETIAAFNEIFVVLRAASSARRCLNHLANRRLPTPSTGTNVKAARYAHHPDFSLALVALTVAGELSRSSRVGLDY